MTLNARRGSICLLWGAAMLLSGLGSAHGRSLPLVRADAPEDTIGVLDAIRIDGVDYVRTSDFARLLSATRY